MVAKLQANEKGRKNPNDVYVCASFYIYRLPLTCMNLAYNVNASLSKGGS